MSILIKNMDMPTDCTDCPLKIYKCDLWKDLKATDYYLHRHKDCPLVEVKTPHGDLIDKNDMRESLRSLMWYDEDGSESELEPWLEEDIMNVPTVIESEE